MGFFKFLTNVFQNNKDDKYSFKKKYENDFLEIEIFNNEEKISLNNFHEREHEYLLRTEICEIDFEKNILKIPYENIYYLDEESFKLFELKYFAGALKIENDVNFLNSSGVRFEIKFSDGDARYRYQHHNIVEEDSTGWRYFLKKSDYSLVKEINAYNLNYEKVRDPAEQYKIADKMHKLDGKSNVILGDDIKRIPPIKIIDEIILDFIEKDENFLEVIPKIKNREDNEEGNNGRNNSENRLNEAFQQEFKGKNNPNKKYSLNFDGKIYEVVLSDELFEALKVVKRNKSEITKKDFLKQDSPIFLDEKMQSENIECNYGPRVKGLGFLNYRPSPTLNNSDIDWFSTELPYIDTTTGEQVRLKPKDIEYLEKMEQKSKDENDSVIVEIETEDETPNAKLLMNAESIRNEIIKIKKSMKKVIDFRTSKDLKALYEIMRDKNQKYVECKNFYVETLDDDKYFLRLITDAEIEEEKNIKNDEDKKKVLLLKDNIEELEHIEEDLEKKEKFEYIAPKSLKENINLLPYQKEGVARMQGLYKKSPLNGILFSDDMGLGKTLQILTFLAWLKEEKLINRVLIVVPKSLVSNWHKENTNEKNQGEIQKFFKKGTFKVDTLEGKIKQNFMNGTDILITSYETLRINHIELGKISWDVMVCDEAQKIKNPKTLLTTAIKTQNAKFKIACSATPIENTILDLWCLVDFSNPGLLGSLKDFKGKYFNKKADDEKLKEVNDNLQNRLGDKFIRRTKEVLNSQEKEFPKKIVSYSHIEYSAKQEELMEKFKHLKISGEAVLPLVQGMIMACSHPKLVEKLDDELDNIEENSEKSLKVGVSNATLMEESLKLIEVKNILEEVKQRDEKAIIFTKYRKMQNILFMVIKEWFELEPAIINGEQSSERRRELLDSYKNKDGFDVIILSPEAAGVGLNITEANHVIHYTRHWNPAKEEQATDRAYRIGQKKDVYVYYPMIAQIPREEKLEFRDINEWIESDKFNFTPSSSPEEKLNKIILNKKRLLRDFFLAAPIDLNETEFKEFNINEDISAGTRP